ncbi:CU044_5270 family protein [Microtetraspora fusca]|uniref:CU044_5270 family protein n=1 Tax=Microtetraspora fusca TaxID=1997 RepID=UPI00082D4326|nr:CU044_5270 family protein [Microtetraspora fusca]
MKEFQLIDEVMPQVPPADYATMMAARARMLGGARRQRRRVWPKVVLAAAAVSMVITGGFVAAPLVGGSDGSGIQTAAVPPDAVLAAAADRLAAQPPGTGAWWRRDMTQVEWTRTPAYTVERRRRDVLWLSREHGARTQQAQISAKPRTPADEQAWRNAGSPDLCDRCEMVGGYFTPLKLTVSPAMELPAEPQALKAKLLSVYVPQNDKDIPEAIWGASLKDTPETWIWGASPWLLLNAETTPATRAALYRVLAGLPGVRVEDNVIDIDGRTGIALTYGKAPTREQIIIDRDSGELLAIQKELSGTGATFAAYVVKRLGWTDDPAPAQSSFS